MKICWDNLEGLRYDKKYGRFFGKRCKSYIEKEKCAGCGEPFLSEYFRDLKYCSKKCQAIYGNPNLGKKLSQESKDAISRKNKGRKAWNSSTIDDIKKLMKEWGYVLVSKEYDPTKKIKYICPNGHLTESRWQDFRFRGCNRCGREKTFNKKRLSYDFVKESFEKEGYEFLSTEYKNAFSKLKFKCPKGHIGETAWNVWQQGGRCYDCKGKRSGEKLKMNFSLIEKSFNAANYSLVSGPDVYENNMSRLEYICPNGHKNETSWMNWASGSRCPTCHPNASKAEREISDSLAVFFSDIKNNDRTIIAPLELDIVIPSKKIAIEYCGLYWHSERGGGKDKHYHLNKLEACMKAGYRLITIFEDEYIKHKDIVMNRLANILGISFAYRIHARKCTIKEISTKEASEFCNRYHLQGYTGANIKLGAFHENQLVSVMTFSRPNIAKGGGNGWELNRFCSDYKCRIPGVASKFLKHFENNYKVDKLFSFADRRWSVGNLYGTIGFTCTGFTQPNYWYLTENSRVHRFNFRKSELKEMENYNPELTEWQIMTLEGFDRMWDCGNYRYEKEY